LNTVNQRYELGTILMSIPGGGSAAILTVCWAPYPVFYIGQHAGA